MTPELLANLNDQVSETVELADLLTHFVGWLLGRDHRSLKAKHLQGVLQIALAEFRREEKAEGVNFVRIPEDTPRTNGA